MPYNPDTGTMEFTEIETKFEAAIEKAQPAIDEQLKIAKQALCQAEKIAEEHGVPFSVYLIGAANEYCPKSFREFGFSEIEDLEHWGLPRMDGYAGWQRSYC